MDITQSDPNGMTYDVTIQYGHHGEYETQYTLDSVTRITGHGNVDDDKNAKLVPGYDLMVHFYDRRGVLIGAFQRTAIRAITQSPTENAA